MTSFMKSLLLGILLLGITNCSDHDTPPEEAPVTVTKTIDLHLHLDGAISLTSARQLAQMQGITIPDTDEELKTLMQVSDDCKDLNEFLEKFAFPCSLIQTPEGLRTATYNLCEELRGQGLIYAEIRFAPSKSCDKGMTQEDAVKAAIEGMRQSSFRANLILCCMRGDDYATNAETIRLTKKYLGQGVCAADLAGAEALFPNADYADVFALARQEGVPYTLHSGEADGPASVWKAIEMGAQRIGHGTRSIEDPQLMDYLAKHQLPLAQCPTSNVQTCIAPSIDQLPIRKFLDAGIMFTINTDDPSIEGTTLQKEWEKVIQAFGLTKAEVRRLMLNSVTASFASPELKQELQAEMESAYPL